MDANADLRYIRDVLERTQRRIDPHAFHFVIWGAIVLVWYPLASLLPGAQLPIGIAALCLGFGLGSLLEWRLHRTRRPRLEGENTFVGRQLGLVVAANIGAGMFLSAFGPATGFVDGERVPAIWGLVYASLAFHTGVIYSREWLWSGAAIFAATLAAMALPDVQGFVLGPAMGLGLLLPGLAGERRVRRMRAEPVEA